MQFSFRVPSLPTLSMPRFTRSRAARSPSRVSHFCVTVPVASNSVTQNNTFLLVKKPDAALATGVWLENAASAEYVSSDPSLPAASTVKFTEDSSQAAPTF